MFCHLDAVVLKLQLDLTVCWQLQQNAYSKLFTLSLDVMLVCDTAIIHKAFRHAIL
jgi:hypothetical protein